MTLQNIKISLRSDSLENWISSDPVLKNGELVMVNDISAGLVRFKIGNGVSAFVQLPYVNEKKVITDFAKAKRVESQYFSQGVNNSASPLGFAAGSYLTADSSFAQVLGINAYAPEGHDYSFVWNGDSSGTIGVQSYRSHGEGTFNVNPVGGADGFYIGNQTLSGILSSTCQPKGNYLSSNALDGYRKYDNTVSSLSSDGYATQTQLDAKSAVSVDNERADVNILHISQEEYNRLVASNTALSNTLYIVSSDYIEVYGQVKNVAPATGLSDAVNLEQLNNSISSIPLDDYLPLSGGNLAGDLSAANANVYILSGNYIQTTDDVDTYGLKNTFIQADTYKESYGKSSVGSKGFYVLSVISNNKLKLSGSINIPTSAYSKVWSVSLDNKLNSQFSTISSIDGQIVTFTSPFDPVIQEKSVSSESQLTALIAGNDNAFYCPTDATLGNVVLNFYGQHAEGGSVHAIAQYSHAEGRATTAEGRYAHAEGGNGTTAGGLASHAEGFGTKALGNRSHSEGSLTYTTMWAAHAEGSETSALGNGSHSEGHFTKASGHYSHAEGSETSAIGNCSHAEGNSTIASAYYSHAEGFQTSAVGNYSHVEGRSSIANGNDGAHAEGYMVSALGGGSHAEGYRTLADAEGSHAEGRQTYAAGKFAHAEGRQTSAVGNYSHAEGRRTLADAENAHAAGYMSQANSANSTAIGRYAKVLSTDNNAFVWQGSTKSVYYESKGLGTFCINPVNGLSGFYIGSENLYTIIDDAISNTAVTRTEFQELTNNIESILNNIISGQISAENQINQI